MLGSSTSQDTHEKKDRPLSSDKTTSDSFRVSAQSIALEIFKNDLESRASDCDDVSVSDEKSFLLGWEDYLNRGMVASEEAICNAPNQIDDTKSKAELTNSNLEISKDIMFDDINEDLENILKLDSQLIMGSQGNFDNLCQNSDVDTLKMEHYRPSTESHNKVKPPSLKITTKKQHKPEEDEDAASSVYSLEQPKKKLESLAVCV
ncbi:hypothetical protein AX774_g7326 [Zancudomyces culisetae]|uniref:Uncharacterized protein n=1 Tax=Zancudomyces culisetae TaxID=1213189 RepID=A0A1R1PE89_ZANCU|nr:hypothetical protein AX774_g7326 [Zancudomyces culisetae]|eukprot:OMH79276.1 hypothetical protein AX774_g7326 [Zancudomyces culisetae]